MEYMIRLDSFEGPLDLLLHLIEKSELDLYDIPIAKITDQYVSYIRAMQELQLDLASEFLVMAATLLAMKSGLLLPRQPQEELEPFEFDIDEESIDPRQLLMERLIEYKKFKHLAVDLKGLEEHRNQLYTKPPDDLTPYIPIVKPNPVKGLTLFDLMDAFQEALRHASMEEPMAHIERDEVSLKDRMGEILGYLKESNGQTSFSTLLGQYRRRSDIVVTFLAILELIKKHQVYCMQEQLFSEILIRSVA